LIREILPNARRIAVLANAADPFHKPFLAQIAAAGQAASIEIKVLLVRGADDYPGAFSEIEKARTDALIVQPSLPNERAAEMAIKYRLPSCAPHPNYPDVGGLMSYSADQPVMFRESASYVDKILKGRKPADLPVALPTKFLLVVNLKTASALGITLPPTLLTRADRVIE
jgi:putative ABC transport system substrate-binding protein